MNSLKTSVCIGWKLVMNKLPVIRNLRDNHIDIHLANWRNHQNCHRLTHHGHSWLDTHRRLLHIQPQSSLVYTRIQANRAYPHHLPCFRVNNKEIVHLRWNQLFQTNNRELYDSGSVPCKSARPDTGYWVRHMGLNPHRQFLRLLFQHNADQQGTCQANRHNADQ